MSDQRTQEPLKFWRPGGPDRVLVIGGGLAGLFTALRLAPLPVTVLTPKPLGQGASSVWAQGGIAAAIGEGDTAESHAADTIAAGAGLTDLAIAEILTREGRERVEDLLRYGVPFDRELDGKLRLSREAAHSARRIVSVQGDRAGRAVMAALITAVSSTPSISVFDAMEAVELVQRNGRIIGVYASRTGQPGRASFLPARAVVLATGGAGQLYGVTTNPKEANSGGLGMAARAGAVIADPEFVQFHPTAFDIGQDPAPLASEAIRGDGALLINRSGERFMLKAHPSAELAPRDVVARAVHEEVAAGRGAFLDCRSIHLEEAFPTAYEICVRAGINPSEQPIPIAPAAHYHMGGVLTDARGRTTLAGLWACGEAACTAVHGANRLASNSLLEAVVFGARVAEDIAASEPHWRALGEVCGAPDTINIAIEDPAQASRLVKRLRETMAAQVGVERSEASLRAALWSLQEIKAGAASPALQNMVTGALLVTAGAFARKESRGAHLRLDNPETAGAKPYHTYLTLDRACEILADATGGYWGEFASDAPRRHAVM
ncbi:MAG: L-aspartate oxidase [Rhodomicrobium sp.]